MTDLWTDYRCPGCSVTVTLLGDEQSAWCGRCRLDLQPVNVSETRPA